MAAISGQRARAGLRARLALRACALGARLGGAGRARRAAAPARALLCMPARMLARMLGLAGGLLAAGGAEGADLPEDQAALMYHSYIGGGVVADGPAMLVRKSLGDSVSLAAQYYVDVVSNASIDVVTTASPYHEVRNEVSLDLDYLYRDALVSLAASRSVEPDYIADSASIDVAQDLFGGMTTVNVGYSRGWDTVGKHNDPSFSEPANHWQYRLGGTQILTARWLMSLNLEAIADEGYLGSPYRVARVFGAAVPETDPSTRNSRAATLRLVGSVGEKGAVRLEYRYFWDTWDIRAHDLQLGYSQYVASKWLLDGYVRTYAQTHALFYGNDFTSVMQYMSRNRQLSTFNDLALGFKASYTALRVPARYEIKLNGSLEWLRFHYDDFTDIRTGQLYSFNATVIELSVTGNF